MGGIALTDTLRREYEGLFHTCVIPAQRKDAVERLVQALHAQKTRYEAVADPMGIPWFFASVIHNMESALRFDRHLHNGDPLTARTVRDPKGHPKTGNPPFPWEESARDAVSLKRLGPRTDWSLAGVLYQLERYNGWGYRRYHPHVLSPYLWSFSNHYTSGKYIRDGVWSDTAVSNQCGAAVLLRRMAETNFIRFPDQPAPAEDAGPRVVRYSMTLSPDPDVVAAAETLQQWLNTFPGIFLQVDGVPGPRTSEAYREVTGSYLPGDPRG